jgi:Pvc16 N-terminal domain
MSNPLAITAVTAAFAQLLTRALTDTGLSGTGVRLEAPDPLQETSGPLLNLFLFDVNPHPAFRADDPRTLALRLHYLLTAYGAGTKGTGGNQLEAQHVLAHAMSYVHDNSMLTRAHVRDAVQAYSAGNDPRYGPLATADLDGDVELVKLTPLPQTPDDVSKLWSALNQSYRLSVAYEASAVLIKRRRTARAAPPVRSAGVYALTLSRPVIEGVAPPSVTVDDQLVLTGRNLRAPEARVRFASGDANPATTRIAAGEIVVRTLPGGLRAGPNVVYVVHDVRMGQPPAPGHQPPLHRGFESNAGLFSLIPKITTELTDANGDPLEIQRGQDFAVAVAPAVGRSQRVALLLGGRALETLVWPAPPASAPDPAATLRFRIPDDHPTGLQLIQLRVDGAESALELETDASDPQFNQFVGPKVNVS